MIVLEISMLSDSNKGQENVLWEQLPSQKVQKHSLVIFSFVQTGDLMELNALAFQQKPTEDLKRERRDI